MDILKENQEMFYVNWKYDERYTCLVPAVICIKWKADFKKYFNKNLVFETKEEAFKVANEIGHSILYPLP